MKKHFIFWLAMFLSISLFLPIYSKADMTLTLEDITGNRIYTPGIKSFAVGTDNNLIIYLNQPFTFKDLVPDIFLGDCTSCNITDPALVSVTRGNTLTFNVQTNVPENGTATISLEAASWEIALPESLPAILPTTNGVAPFSWSTQKPDQTGGTYLVPTGSYIAVFQAKVTTAAAGDHISQLPVTINVNPPELISNPVISGPSVGTVGQSYTFTASGAILTPQGDQVQYFIDFGDGTPGWLPVGTTSASKSWAAAGPYTVTVQARCATHTSIVSGTSTAQIVISNIPTYTVTVSVNNSAGGSVSPSSQTVQSGGAVTFTVTTNSGYTASVSEGTLSQGTWTISNVTSSHTATITFTQPQAGDLLTLSTYIDKYIPAGTDKVYVIRASASNLVRLRLQLMGTSTTTLATYKLTLSDGREFPALLGYQNQIGMIYLELRSQLASGGGNITGNYLPVGDYVLTIHAVNSSDVRIWANLYDR